MYSGCKSFVKYVIWKYFSHFVTCLLTLIVSFDALNFKIFMVSTSSIFYFSCYPCPCCSVQEIITKIAVMKLLPYVFFFFLENFINPFKYLIILSYFLYRSNFCKSLIPFICLWILFFQHHSLKRLPFPY